MTEPTESCLWRKAYGSARGISHAQRNQPNQDCVRIRTRSSRVERDSWPTIVVAVADGHGAVPHIRSDRGARTAAEVAAEVFERHLMSDSERWGDLTPKSSLIKSEILNQWRTRVTEDLTADPFHETECGDEDERRRALLSLLRDRPLLAYGTTLMVVAVNPFGDWAALQVGDGDILRVDDDSVHAMSSLRAPEGPQGSTASLCEESLDALRFRHGIGDHEARAFVVLTDGVRNSWGAESEFLAFQRHVARAVAVSGESQASDQLTAWAGKMASHGAGDDTTIACIARAGMLWP